jgi:hypothetical protein
VQVYQSSATFGTTYSGAAGSTVTVLLENPLPIDSRLGDWVSTDGLSDTRICVPGGVLYFISHDRKKVSFNIGEENSLNLHALNLTPVLGTAKLYLYDNTAGANNAGIFRFSGTNSSSAAFVTQSGGADTAVFATLTGSQVSGLSTTSPEYTAGAGGQWAIRANSKFRIELDREGTKFMYAGADSTAVYSTAVRTSVTPVQGVARFKTALVSNTVMTRPVAKIVSAVHATASTTTVVTLDVTPTSAGLAVGNYVALRNIANQTIFANSGAGTAITAIDDALKTITLPWGAATAGTSYGGSAILQKASIDQPGMLPIVTNASYDATLDVVTLTSTSTWSGFGGIGAYVNVHGVRNSTTGADLGIDGVWEVSNHTVGTVLNLKALYDINGVRVSPVVSALAATNSGGSVILRTTVYIAGVEMYNRNINTVEIAGAGTADATRAIPTYSMGGIISQGPAASVGTNGGGAWPVRNALNRTADITATTTTTVGQAVGGVVDVTTNAGAMQYYTNVTALTGTNVRYFTRLEGSWDTLTYFTVYDTPVQKTVASKLAGASVVMPIHVPFLRWVRDVRGTTPSVTYDIIRTVMPSQAVRRQRRMNDRVVSLTALTASTERLWVEGCTRLQITCTPIPGMTGAPEIGVEVCNGDPDVASNWYTHDASVSGDAFSPSTVAPVVFKPSATVATRSVVASLPAPVTFMRLKPTVVATGGVVADTYELVVLAWEE